MSESRISVLCVDDHRIVLEGIELILARHPDIVLIESATSGEEAIESFRRHVPDVTLMDLQLGGISGVEAIRTIRHEFPQARIVVLTMSQGDEDMFRALQAGATTYLLKDTLADDLVRIVREVHAGKQPLRPDVKARLMERAAGPTLTPREVQVVELISEGMQNKEIAAVLGISDETVHVHVKNIFWKLKVTDRSAAMKVALRRGIIHIT